MPNLILTVEVSQTMFEAIKEKFPTAEITTLGNLPIDISLESSKIPDTQRLYILELVKLSLQYGKGQ